MGGMVESVSTAYKPILSTHEKGYGPLTIYQDLCRAIQANLEQLDVLIDSAWGKWAGVNTGSG